MHTLQPAYRGIAVCQAPLFPDLQHPYGFLHLPSPLVSPQVPLNEYEFPTSKLANVQSQLEKLVEKNYYLHQSAKEAFR